jgi:hypothetical protein
MSEPTEVEATMETMAERREQLRKDLLATAAKIRGCVVKDLRRFIEREARWRWLQHLDFADGMSDGDIADLKKKLTDLADSVGREINSDLSDPAQWLAPREAPASEQLKSLEHNTNVWAILQKPAFRLAEILEASGFPADPTDADRGDASHAKYHLEYRTPLYFLEGTYCPSLIETYWNQLGELRELGDTIDSTQADARRQKLEERWGKL